MTEVSSRRCMKKFAHPSIYYDMTWDIWVYWSGIIALERGADSTILWGGRVISGPSTDTAQQVGVPVLSCAAILKLIATSYIQRKKNRCRDKQTTRYKVVSHKFSPTTVLLSLIQLYVVQLSPCGKVSISRVSTEKTLKPFIHIVHHLQTCQQSPKTSHLVISGPLSSCWNIVSFALRLGPFSGPCNGSRL